MHFLSYIALLFALVTISESGKPAKPRPQIILDPEPLENEPLYQAEEGTRKFAGKVDIREFDQESHDEKMSKSLPPEPPLKIEQLFIEDQRYPVSQRTSNRDTSERILGGQAAEPNEWPWHVAVFIYDFLPDDEVLFCSGALIAEKWVITSRHCMRSNNIEVTAGAHEIYDENEGTRQTRSMVNSYHWVLQNRQGINAVALIELDSKFIYNDEIHSVCLTNEHIVEVSVTATGWGWVNGNEQQLSEVLMDVELDTITHDECTESYPVGLQWYHLCTKISGKGICRGDSGGPLTHTNGVVYELVGISAFGPPGCPVNAPYGFIRMSHFTHSLWPFLVSKNIDMATEIANCGRNN